jgi:hypothetical protein
MPFVANIFVIQNALFPFWTDYLAAPWAQGFLYAAIGWGGAIDCAGLVQSLPLHCHSWLLLVESSAFWWSVC